MANKCIYHFKILALFTHFFKLEIINFKKNITEIKRDREIVNALW